MKTFFRALAILSGIFAGFALLTAGTRYMRDPTDIPVLWLETAAISLLWSALFAVMSRRLK